MMTLTLCNNWLLPTYGLELPEQDSNIVKLLKLRKLQTLLAYTCAVRLGQLHFITSGRFLHYWNPKQRQTALSAGQLAERTFPLSVRRYSAIRELTTPRTDVWGGDSASLSPWHGLLRLQNCHVYGTLLLNIAGWLAHLLPGRTKCFPPPSSG